jgi:hypothetical protein
VKDVEAASIAGVPFLRADLVLVCFRRMRFTQIQFGAWIDRLQSLHRKARSFETANLPQLALIWSGSIADDKTRVIAEVAECGHVCDVPILLHARKYFVAREQSPRLNTKRIFGLYPLTGLFVAGG